MQHPSFLAILSLAGFSVLTAKEQPNVLFLAVDDMRTWVGCMGEDYPGKIHTPHIDRLAEQGRLFTNAHVPAPMCGPCRAALLSGQLPSRLGIYSNHQWVRPIYPELVTLPKHFKNNGYHVAGAGKIAHHTAGFTPPDEWHDFQEIDWEDPWDRPLSAYPYKRKIPKPEKFPISGITVSRHEFDWGSLPEGYEYHDPKSATYAVDFLKDYDAEKPFFLACGIFRPHIPWYAPKEYFDLYPLDQIKMPLGLKKDDLDDVPKAGQKISKSIDYDTITEAGRYKEALQAYLASISFADAQIGRVLEALKKSPYAENTIIVLWSDHGWHHGEKNHWHKWTLWEDATRIPFIIAGPPVKAPGKATDTPVSLLSIYPTLIDLCSLPKPEQPLDGELITSILDDPLASPSEAIVIERLRGECAVRSKTHRYIRYADGSEELYDLSKDPHEWNNLASEPSSAKTKGALAKHATTDWKKPIPSKGAFKFDPKSYSWEKK